MAAPGYLDYNGAMEINGALTGYHTNNFCFSNMGYLPMSRLHCSVNILSGTALSSLKSYWQQQGWLVTVDGIHTGGGFAPLAAGGVAAEPVERVRWPTLNQVPVWRNNYGNFVSRANGVEWTEARQFYNMRIVAPLVGDIPVENIPMDHTECSFNVHLALWRLAHPALNEQGQPISGQYRLVPVTVEGSHHAEAYHYPGILFPNWHKENKVEIVEMEKDWVNGDRKLCNQGGLMWRFGEGERFGQVIPLGEDYRGLTMCRHASFGSPCYGPHPTQRGTAPTTGQTPSERKIGQASPGEGDRGGREWALRGRGQTEATKAKKRRRAQEMRAAFVQARKFGFTSVPAYYANRDVMADEAVDELYQMADFYKNPSFEVEAEAPAGDLPA